jgi:hypothetical protein
MLDSLSAVNLPSDPQHGGRVSASANAPRGAVFQFTLRSNLDNIVQLILPRLRACK